MAEAPNIYVSNGTCYTGPDNVADAAMIPCGNAYFQPQACCQHDDHCLESSVCYNSAHGVTYIAGCTDKEYTARVCPDKFDDADAPWLGMSYCNDASNDWVLCDQKDHPATIVDPDPCTCPSVTTERSMTLNQAQGIAETASLPSATGLPIDWNTDFYPTVPSVLPSSSTATQTTRASATIATSYSGSTARTGSTAANSSPPFPTSLTTSAKIGTAIGASVFGFVLLSLLGFYILRRRRHRRRKQPDLNNADEKTPDPDHALDPRTIGVAYGGDDGGNHVDLSSSRRSLAVDHKAARPWSMVSELDGYGARGDVGGLGSVQAIMEASHGRGVGTVRGGGQDAAGLVELEALRGVAELSA